LKPPTRRRSTSIIEFAQDAVPEADEHQGLLSSPGESIPSLSQEHAMAQTALRF